MFETVDSANQWYAGLADAALERGLALQLCLPSVTLGDEDKHFSRSLDQAQRRDSRANQSATAPGRR